MEQRLAEALQGRRCTQYTYATVHEDVPPELPADPAFTPSYPPYPYQRQAAALLDAIYCEGAQHNLLVASPTGSGKSFAIQWAARRALQEGYRLIVGVPLVALAEQIYGQLRRLLADVALPSSSSEEEWDDCDNYGYAPPCQSSSSESPVGIRTGPSEQYPEAPVLVCTYEVVLLLQHHDLTLMDRMPVLLLDEIHTIADPDRGHVVETLLGQLPPDVCIVGMSGTLPNVQELADFMGRCNRQTTHIIGAVERPIALEHHLAPPDGKLRAVPAALRWAAELELPEQLGRRQQDMYVHNLVRTLEEREMLPAMCVAFSCRRLNDLAASLATIDLVGDKRLKSRIHLEFHRVRCLLEPTCPEEWGLFEPLLELAQRGIGVHHAQQPKLYLELLPQLVQKGRIKLIFATSTLSAGIDLPVRTVAFVGGLRMPGKRGFRPIAPNLFHQICGRAGRPGQETEGHVVIGLWSRCRQDPDLKTLLEMPPQPVRSQYLLTPSLVLRVLARGDMETVLRRSFASDDITHIPPLLNELARAERDLALPPEMVTAWRHLRTARACAAQLTTKVAPGHVLRLDPEPGQLFPPAATVTTVTKTEIATQEFGVIDRSWIFRNESAPAKKSSTTVEAAEAQRQLHAALDALVAEGDVHRPTPEQRADLERLERWVDGAERLRHMAAVEQLWIWPTYLALERRLTQQGFLASDLQLTLKGKLAAGIVAANDALTLIQAWTSGLLPREPLADFVAGLTPFLAQRKTQQEGTDDPLYVKLAALQHQIWEGDEADMRLGSWMLGPMRQWMGGASVLAITLESDVAAGHLCKELQRTQELLRQLAEAAMYAGDCELQQLCPQASAALTRGLPFVPSLFLR